MMCGWALIALRSLITGSRKSECFNDVSVRIHGAGMFTYIGIMLNYTLGANVGKYSSTMDPLSIECYDNMYF